MKTHKKMSLILIAAIIISILLVGSAEAKSPNKVDVCHKNGNGSYSLLKINPDALPAHQSHGDAAPGSAVPSQPGMVFSSDCSAIATAQSAPAQPITAPLGIKHGKKADKVNVCHRRGNGTFILININRNALPAHLAHGDGLPAGVVPSQPHMKFAANCSVSQVPQKELVQTLTVSSSATTPISSLVLENGQLYEIKASGTYTYDLHNDWADAEWLVAGGLIQKGDNNPPLPPNVLDLTINGCSNNTDWGAYQPTHAYTLQWTGTGVPLTFMVCDVDYTDNVGDLTVEIWKINW